MVSMGTPRAVWVWVEEEFGVQHVVAPRATQVGARHVVESRSLQQHAGAGVVDVRKLCRLVNA